MNRREMMLGGAGLAVLSAVARGGENDPVSSEALVHDGGREAEPWVALLSDPHIAADPRRAVRGVRMAEQFEAVTKRLVDGVSGPPGLIFINGDVALDDGNNGDYAVLNRLLAGLGSLRQRVYVTAGNHDHRGNLLDAALFPGRPVVTQKLCQRVSDGPVDWYLLDSLRYVDEVAGALGESQLAWLAEQLDARPARPALILSHHPPEDPNDAGDDGFGLADSVALLDLLRPRRQVKALFHGHKHEYQLRTDHGLHIVGQPSTAYVFRDGVEPGYLEARVGVGGLSLTRRALSPDGPHEANAVELAFR
jgi:3',5'-cyclic AMP phosphodiesterase CpdA